MFEMTWDFIETKKGKKNIEQMALNMITKATISIIDF